MLYYAVSPFLVGHVFLPGFVLIPCFYNPIYLAIFFLLWHQLLPTTKSRGRGCRGICEASLRKPCCGHRSRRQKHKEGELCIGERRPCSPVNGRTAQLECPGRALELSRAAPLSWRERKLIPSSVLDPLFTTEDLATFRGGPLNASQPAHGRGAMASSS